MSSISHHFKVGKFNCILVNDGSLAYTHPAQAHFANAPADQLASALLRYHIQLDRWDEWISPLPCLVIQTGNEQILVDTGLGNVDFGPNAGRLLPHLQVEGILPGDIDAVILTHAHGDHIGGNAGADGFPAFPHARYLMRKEEWDFWTSETTLAQEEYEWMTPFVDRQLLPLANRFMLLEKEAEIVPGIRTVFAPGHTPGSLALVVASQGEQLLCLGDVVTHPIHLEQPGWHIAPDCQPEEAVLTRRQLLEHAAAEHCLVFAFHFDFPGLGYVQTQQQAWRWQPLQ